MKQALLTRRQILGGSAGGLAAIRLAVSGQAHAQVGRKLVRIVVGFPAGGSTDVLARILAERLRLTHASTVMVENKPGASARLAVEHVKNAEPDGSVLLFTPEGPIAVFPHSFRKLSYDPLGDLVPVAPMVKTMLAFNIGSVVPESVQSLPDFLQWCNANPNHATVATVPGSPPHFVAFMLASSAGVQIVHVPYRGGTAALQDLLGAHIAGVITLISDALPLANSAARTLAVSGSQRSRFLPDVPTMRELGYDIAVEPWIGIFAPAKLAAETLHMLNAAIGEAVNSPEMIEQLVKFGVDPMFQGPDEFASTVKASIDRWGPVVKASGFVAG